MTSEPAKYDLIVIGRGLIGSAAARHAELRGDRIALVGPTERPRNVWSEVTAFGAHFDEGRIARRGDPDRIWSELAGRSISRYAEVAAQGGERFFSEVGHLVVGGPAFVQSLEARAKNGAAQGAQCERLSAAELAARFPYLRFHGECEGMHEKTLCGYISPRKMVAAQCCSGNKAKHNFQL